MTDAQLGMWIMVGAAVAPGLLVGFYAHKYNDLQEGLFWGGFKSNELGLPLLTYAIAFFVYQTGELLFYPEALSWLQQNVDKPDLAHATAYNFVMLASVITLFFVVIGATRLFLYSLRWLAYKFIAIQK